MSTNASYRLAHTSILSVVPVEAPEVVPSSAIDDRLLDVYAETGMLAGSIERLAGVKERRWYGADEDFTDGAVEAGRRALEAAGVAPEKVGLVVNASVTRPHLEPGISSKVHHELGMPRDCLAFDITNACLGVLNAMHVAGTMIDAGQIEYALVVAAEGAREMQEASIARLNESATKQDVKDAFATFTLGSGAVGIVLGRSDAHPDGHRIVGGITRAGTEHHRLCIGGMDGMTTNSRQLFVEGIALATDAWNSSAPEWGWNDMDWYVVHQTSTVHIAALAESLGLPREKFPVSIDRYGNIGPVALPFTLGLHQQHIEKGQRVLLMGIGSGLNTSFMEIDW